MDPRLSVITSRLSNINKIISVVSGKGGVGKTVISSLMAYSLARKGKRVGLLDLDFHGPSCHVVLGIRDVFPEEEKGLIPPVVHDISFMSIYFFVGAEPAPLRGNEITNSIIELLAITRWPKLDFLIIDLPPGMGDEALDTIRLIKRGSFLVVTTPSKLSLSVVSRLIKLLKNQNLDILGLLENMKIGDDTLIQTYAKGNGIKYLGSIPFDNKFELALGDINKIVRTDVYKSIDAIVSKYIFS